MNPAGLSEVSFSQLYRQYGRDVYRYAFYLSGNAALAEDISSETFLRVWNSAQPLRLPSVKSYLLAIARNLYLHDLRRKDRSGVEAEHLPSPASFTTDIEARDELRHVLRALQSLPEVSRTALLLHAEHQLPY